jgi:hypothetical protein
MIQEHTSTATEVSTVISSIAAVIAILVALLVEWRTNKRFSRQLEREEKIAIANVKPILSVYPSKFINNKAVTLHNYGIGTAVITGISFSKGSKVEKVSLVNLFSLAENVAWDYFWNFRQDRYYVQPGQDIVLVKLTEENLMNQGFDQQEAEQILETWQKQMDGISIQINYEDILSNPQPIYRTTLVS